MCIRDTLTVLGSDSPMPVTPVCGNLTKWSSKCWMGNRWSINRQGLEDWVKRGGRCYWGGNTEEEMIDGGGREYWERGEKKLQETDENLRIIKKEGGEIHPYSKLP